MIDAAKEHRLTCNEPGPRNPMGRPKLVVKIVSSPEKEGECDAGLWVWCRNCLKPYFVSREACMAAWERNETVVKGCGHS